MMNPPLRFDAAAFFRYLPAVLILALALHAEDVLNGAVPSGNRAAAAPSTVDVFIVLDGQPAAAFARGSKAGFAPAGETKTAKQRGMELMARHAALQSQLEAKGARLKGQITRLGNALKIRVAEDKLAEIAALPGVKRIVKTRHYQRALVHSVPFVGSAAAWSRITGLADGRAVRVGVIDTGIDYTHADFGGSGKVADYTDNDPTRIEPGTFPTSKIAGGFDFAGDAYDAGDPANAIPHPDPDPLDSGPGRGHGTHVAGILGGFGVLTNGQTYPGEYSTNLDFSQFAIGPGVAPRTLLYALKIFGGDGSTDLVVEALEWAADPNGDYDFSDHLDVVNLSLGSTFGTDDPEDPELVAINNLSLLGCVVVCAAGNDGNIFYAAGPPGSASRAISVGNSIDKAERSAIELLSPAAIAGKYQAFEGDFTAPLTNTGPIVGQVVRVEPNDACGTLQNRSALKGNVALIDRGTCLFVDKTHRAYDAGAIAVIMVNNQDGPPIVMGGDNTNIPIPGVMISKADGALIEASLSEPVTARLDVALKVVLPQFVDNLDESSSRGPVGLANYLKPELVAPGMEIVSADVGTGVKGRKSSGTSMASPMVAGAAALLRQAHPDWTVEAIKAALMNSAVGGHDTSYHPYPESLAGAGRLQVDQALRLEVTAQAANDDGNVALSYGSLAFASLFQTNRSVVLSNHGSNEAVFRVVVSNTVPQSGVSLTPENDSVTVAPHGTATLSFQFRADPAQFNLQHDPVTPQTVVSLPRQSLCEVSGEIWFHGETQSMHVPYYANLRAASEYRAETNKIVLTPEANGRQKVEVSIPLRGASATTNAIVSAFELGATFPDKNLLSIYLSDAHLLAVGAASDFAAAGSMDNANVYFGLATATSWPTPQYRYVDLEVLIDTNHDGYADFILVNDNASLTNNDASTADVFLTMVQNFNAPEDSAGFAGGGFINVFPADMLDTAPFNNSVMIESVAAAQIGLSDANSRFRYRVQTSGTYKNVSQTGWISFDAAQPVVDTTAGGLERTPVHADGKSIRVQLDREAAANDKQRLPGVLLLHHHNLEGNRIDVVRLDLANDDLDHDGLPDWWEIKYFTDLTTAGKDTDFDGDGVSDLNEYLAGTDPDDPASYLKFLSATSEPAGGVSVSWSSAYGKTYTLLRSPNLAFTNWSPLAQSQLATPPINLFLDTNNIENKTYFYRVRVE